jgi:hypothetical protein
MTGRVPVLPEFTPSHVDKSAGPIPVSEVFDIPLLEATLGIPILEWHEVKDLSEPVSEMPDEQIGCWSVHQALFNEDRHATTEELMKLGELSGQVVYCRSSCPLQTSATGRSVTIFVSAMRLPLPQWRTSWRSVPSRPLNGGKRPCYASRTHRPPHHGVERCKNRTSI